jgi:hypothetical protein
MTFEDYLPKKGCPPSDAIPGPKLLFRLVKTSRFDDTDFKTTYEEGTFPKADLCRRCSISTLSSFDAAQELRRLIPNLASRLIAHGVVPDGAGLVMHTPSRGAPDHWSWWPAAAIRRESFFELAE